MTDNVVISEGTSNDVPATEAPVAEKAPQDASATESASAENVKEEAVPAEVAATTLGTEEVLTTESVSVESSKENAVKRKILNEDDKKVAIEIVQRVLLGNNTALGDYTVEQISDTVALLKIESSELKTKRVIDSLKAQFVSNIKSNESAFNEELDTVPGVVELRQKYQANLVQNNREYLESTEKVLKEHDQEKLDATRDEVKVVISNLAMNKWLAEHAEVIRSLSKQLSELSKPEAEQNSGADKQAEPVLADSPVPAEDKPVESVLVDTSVPAEDKPVESVVADTSASVEIHGAEVIEQGLAGSTLPDGSN
jgi:hypothetical protein